MTRSGVFRSSSSGLPWSACLGCINTGFGIIGGLVACRWRHRGDLLRLAGWKSRSMADRFAKAAAEQRARAAHARLGLGDRI